MLEQKDYKQIKKIFKEQGKDLEVKLSNKIDKQGKDLEVKLSNKIDKQYTKIEKNIVVQLGEVIEDNIIPAVERIIDKKLDKIEKDIARLPDKAYLSDKLAELEGSVKRK